jgi:nitrate reductase assembly molybdenum cofactor insertion protein NarJ
MFAQLLCYPNKETLTKVESAQEFLNQKYPDAAEILQEFTEFARTIPLWKWEEIYTRTFDVQAITTLDVGYVLFGDDYKRGVLLVNLSKEHTKAGNDCETELADHLPNLLRLLDKVSDKDFKVDLIYLIIKPALKKIIDEFDSRNIEKKNKIYEKHHRTLIQFENNYGTVYQYLLQALLMVLDEDFSDDKKIVAAESQFTTKFADEMELPD